MNTLQHAEVDNTHLDLQVWLGLCCDHTDSHGRIYVVYGPYHGVEVSRLADLPNSETLRLPYFSDHLIRTQFRRRANAADNKAATVAVDSLLNYEAVKVRTQC